MSDGNDSGWRRSAGTGPCGEAVLTRGAPVTVRFTDGSPDGDATGWLADLVLVGWREQEAAAAYAALDVDQVQVASLSLPEDLEVLLLDADGHSWDIDHATAADLASAGLATLLTDGIAAEAATAGDEPPR